MSGELACEAMGIDIMHKENLGASLAKTWLPSPLGTFATQG